MKLINNMKQIDILIFRIMKKGNLADKIELKEYLEVQKNLINHTIGVEKLNK